MTAQVDSVEASAYTIPTDTPEADGTKAWDSTTLVLVRVSSGGAVGLGWTYAPAAAAAVVQHTLATEVTGKSAMDIGACYQAMVRSLRNAGRQGIGSCAISAVDIALWDLKSRLLDLPLHHLLGAVHRGVPVYGSGGFTTYTAERMQQQLSGWVHDDGVGAVKIKIAESAGSQPDRDLRRMGQARDAVGEEVDLFVDANGGYTAKQAVRIMDRAADLDISWLEEPVSSDDLPGLREVRRAVSADVAAGEYGWDPYYFERMCAAAAVDCLQADVTRCGGITGWFQAATVAQVHHLELSAHCAPGVSTHAAAATSNLRHLEWFHDHVRIEQMLFDGVLSPVNGQLVPDDKAPGLGITLNTAAAEPYRVA